MLSRLERFPSCGKMNLKGNVIYFSYDTIIGYLGVSASHGVMVSVRSESPSVSTSGHMTKLGIKGFSVVTPEELEAHLPG